MWVWHLWVCNIRCLFVETDKQQRQIPLDNSEPSLLIRNPSICIHKASTSLIIRQGREKADSFSSNLVDFELYSLDCNYPGECQNWVQMTVKRLHFPPTLIQPSLYCFLYLPFRFLQGKKACQSVWLMEWGFIFLILSKKTANWKEKKNVFDTDQHWQISPVIWQLEKFKIPDSQ